VADFCRVVTIKGLDGKLRAGTQFGHHLRKLILRQAENHRNRLELGDDEEPIRVGSMHNVTGIHETKSDAPADRGGDMGVSELEFGVVDLSLI